MAFNPYYEEHPYDIMAPWVPAPVYSRQYHRPWYSPPHHNHIAMPRVDANRGSNITMDKDKFQVCLDVHQFSPKEITVKTIDRHIIVEGKHDEKEDEHGLVQRHFVRKYLLPEGHHSEDVVCSLSTDGILCVTGPKKAVDSKEGERVVPISIVGPLNGAIKKSTPDEETAPEKPTK